MSGNLLRKAALLGINQQKLSFMNQIEVEICDASTQYEPGILQPQLPDFEQQFSCQIQIQSQEIQCEIPMKMVEKEEDKKEIKALHICEDCEKNFTYKFSLKRHILEQHSNKPKLYLKHDKIDGKFFCSYCNKQYKYSRDLKVQLQNHHGKKFEVIDSETGEVFLQKGKTRDPLESLEERVKKENQLIKAVRNLPASDIIKITIKIHALKLPILYIIDLKGYLTLEDKFEKKVITEKQHAYKIYPFNYFKCDDKHQLEFVNKYQALTKARERPCRFIIKLDAILLAQDHVAFLLPLYQMTLIDYIQDQRIPKQLPLILTNVCKAIEELNTLGYVHRDLKPENIDFQSLRVVIIDINRSQRVEASGLSNVYGTPGNFPEREDWRDGEIKWEIWALASIIAECDMARNDYYSCKKEKDSKQRIHQYLDQNKIKGKMKDMLEYIIIKPNHRTDHTIDQIVNWIGQINFRKLPHDAKVLFE